MNIKEHNKIKSSVCFALARLMDDGTVLFPFFAMFVHCDKFADHVEERLSQMRMQLPVAGMGTRSFS